MVASTRKKTPTITIRPQFESPDARPLAKPAATWIKPLGSAAASAFSASGSIPRLSSAPPSDCSISAKRCSYSGSDAARLSTDWMISQTTTTTMMMSRTRVRIKASPLERPIFLNQFMMGVVHTASTRASRMGDRISLVACMPSTMMNMAASVMVNMTRGELLDLELSALISFLLSDRSGGGEVSFQFPATLAPKRLAVVSSQSPRAVALPGPWTGWCRTAQTRARCPRWRRSPCRLPRRRSSKRLRTYLR